MRKVFVIHSSANYKLRSAVYAVLALPAVCALAAELHVSVNGSDSQTGTRAEPFRTIQRAADAAKPGDIVTVHAGVYRERVNPPRGGDSDARRIVYQAAPGETVEIKGSEIVKDWKHEREGVWQVVLPAAFFGGFNPYADLIRGDWFNPKGREHHTGAVYLDGVWLDEAAKLEDVFASKDKPLWFAKVEDGTTTIWARFGAGDIAARSVEINVRQSVFYPDRPGRNYITVRGFLLRHAATPWAPPTAEQIGLIGTHWSKGWIIESNTISHSRCCGITLGKYGDEFDNTSADTAEGYVKTIARAHAHAIAWTKENIGHHIVRGNTISHCEQAGIVGSMGCTFSEVTGNVIHDIHVRKLFTGAEMAGIKFHGAINTTIERNRIFRTCRGLWLDWMTQGTRVSKNLFYENGEDVFVEVNHGPFLLENNLLLSGTSLRDWSQGGAYVHNLIAGEIQRRRELKRDTPYHMAHSTEVKGLANIKGGDNRFFNNIFIGDANADRSERAAKKANADLAQGFGLWVYDLCEYPSLYGGNLFLNGARPSSAEAGAIVQPDFALDVRLSEKPDGLYLAVAQAPERLAEVKCLPVTTASLGKALLPDCEYVSVDGAPLTVASDYFGKPHDQANPAPGPFKDLKRGQTEFKVW